MALKLVETIVNILKSNPEKSYTARDLAESICQCKPEECKEKMETTKAATPEALIDQLIAEIGARKKQILKAESKIRTTEEYPRKYYYSEKTDIEEIEEAESITKKMDIQNMICIHYFVNIYIMN